MDLTAIKERHDQAEGNGESVATHAAAAHEDRGALLFEIARLRTMLRGALDYLEHIDRANPDLMVWKSQLPLKEAVVHFRNALKN